MTRDITLKQEKLNNILKIWNKSVSFFYNKNKIKKHLINIRIYIIIYLLAKKVSVFDFQKKGRTMQKEELLTKLSEYNKTLNDLGRYL